jgi:lipopolysaccharide biosynthesis glycosyltransferase
VSVAVSANISLDRIFVIPIFVGYDSREAVAYHTFCQSAITGSSQPIAFLPLHGPLLNHFDGQRDGTNAFIYSRYLIPSLMGFQGFAIFVDGDMVLLEDIAKLWELRDERYAVQVVKHDYQTKHPRKYIGTAIESDNVDYPRKNWSSVMIFNCGHPSNRILTREFVENAGGSFLHRFRWLNEVEVGELPAEWNVLVGEQDHKDPKLLHYTLGIPLIPHYADCEYADEWWLEYNGMKHVIGTYGGWKG